MVVKVKLKINKFYACTVNLIINRYFSYKMLLNIKLTTQLSITQFLVVTLLFIYYMFIVFTEATYVMTDEHPTVHVGTCHTVQCVMYTVQCTVYI